MREFITSLQIELISTLIIGISSYILGRLLELLIRRIRASRAPLSGEWIQRIYEPGSRKLVKIDRVLCSQIGEKVRAKIYRVQPEDQRNRAWNFDGMYRGNDLFGYFESKDIKDPSFGTIFMRQYGRGRLRGYYTKSKPSAQEDQKWDKFVVTTTPIPLEWYFKYSNYEEGESGGDRS